MEHLALEIFDLQTSATTSGTNLGSKYANLPEGASITITETSEIFASGDVWSHPFTLNTHANAHIFGTSGEIHGSRLHEQINKRRARLWVEGLPLYLGYLKLDDEVDVDEDGNVDVTFESGQKTFDDMIEGAKANQVPMMSDVLIGMALWRKRKSLCTLQLTASATLSNGETASPASRKYPLVYQGQEPHTGTQGTHIGFSAEGENDGESVQPYPRMVFPKGEFEVVAASPAVTENSDRLGGLRPGGQPSTASTEAIDCLNTDYPYDDAHPYCNVAICYQKYGYIKKQKDGSETEDYSSEPEAQRGYEVAPADRINSAPNFFVIYWIRALMKHLGIYVEENQMMDVEDLRRLFFVNTNCAYKEPKSLRTGTVDSRYGKYQFVKSGRNTNRLVPEYFGERSVAKVLQGKKMYEYDRGNNINAEESKFSVKTWRGDPSYDTKHVLQSEVPSIKEINVSIHNVENWSDSNREQYERDNNYLHGAIATSDCFPNVDISEVIQAIESGFGVRFLFDGSYQRVRIVLLRNIFRNEDVQEIACDIISETKQENSTRGFRMTYGNSEDTSFYYKGFADKLPHKKPYFADNSDEHDYSRWNLKADYASLIDKVSAFDTTCYVTPKTGNAYIIKVDKDAKRYDDLHPSLFGCADFMDAEDGDCTGEEETIETINVGFSPAIMNDVNFENERSGDSKQRFALFVDETMRPRRPDLQTGEDYNDPETDYDVYDGLYAKVKNSKGEDTKEYVNGKMMDNGIVKPGEFFIGSDMCFSELSGLRINLSYEIKKKFQLVDKSSRYETVKYPVNWPITFDMTGCINEGYRLYLQDNYEPNDDGVAPIETKDWGLTLGIMRGSGSDAYVDYRYDPDDGEGNDTWEKVPGSSVTAHPDTCDSYGREWDYNGTIEGIGAKGRFSLKLRAEKLNPYFDPTKAESSSNRRYLTITSENLRRRGLADQFYKEYSYWVRNARIVKREVKMELAQLLDIDKTVQVSVGDVKGFVRKMQYSVSNKTGLGQVTMEIMYI